MLSTRISSKAPGAAAPARVTVLVIAPGAKLNSPKVGIIGVGVLVGIGAGVGVSVGVSVMVGKANTSVFMGTVTAMD